MFKSFSIIPISLFILIFSLFLLYPVESIILIKTPTNYAKDFASALKYKTISYDPSDLDNPINYNEFRGFIQFLEKVFPKVHRTLERNIINNYSLLFKWQGTNSTLKPLMINAHYDVVPTSSTWPEAFNGTIKDGFIYGRGAIDNKLIVMSSLEAVEALLTHDFQPKRTVYLAFGHDEEIGGNQGHKFISKFLQDRNITAEMIIDEGSAIMKEGFLPGIVKQTALIGNYEKGYLFYNLTVSSPGGHSAMPPPESAIGILSKAILNIESNQFLPLPLSEVGSPFLRLFTQEQIKNTPYLSSMLKTTTAVTMTRAGIKPNVIASSATVWINHRIVKGSNVTYTLNRIKEIINDTRVSMVIDGSLDPSPVSPTNSSAYILLTRTLKNIYGNNLRVTSGQMFANTDTRHYWKVSQNIYRIMPIVSTFSEFSAIHADNEKISIDQYIKAINFYKKLILKFQLCFTGENIYQKSGYSQDPDLIDCDCDSNSDNDD